MSAISRLYETAKSLLLNQPQEQENIQTKSTCIIPDEHIRTKTKYPSVKMLKDIESTVAKEGSQTSNPLASNKKRSRINHQEDNEATVTLSSKKQKALPLREKNSDVLKTPKTLRLKEKLQKKNDLQSGSQSFLNLNSNNLRHIKKGDNEISEESETSSSKVRTPINQCEKGNSDATPFYTAQHYRFGSEDDLEERLQSSALANTSSINITFHESDNESEDDLPETITTQMSKQAGGLKIKDITKAVVTKKSQIQKRKLFKQKQRLKKKRLDNDQGVDNLIDITESSTLDFPLENKLKEDDHTGPPLNNTSNAHKSSSEKLGTRLSLTSKHSLPDLLPLEFLEDEEEEDNSLTVRNMLTKKPPSITRKKRIRFDELVEKELRDRRMGTTTFRVLKKNSQSLAPKASYRARRTKELWLQGRSGRKQELNEQPFSRSFNKN